MLAESARKVIRSAPNGKPAAARWLLVIAALPRLACVDILSPMPIGRGAEDAARSLIHVHR